VEKILRKIKRAVKKKFSLSILLKIANIAYVCRLLIDQPYVRRASTTSLSAFRSGIVPKLGVIARKFSIEGVRQKHLQIVIACLKSAKIDYFVIPNATRTHYKVGVLAEDREKFLSELGRQTSNTGLYIAMANRMQNGFKNRQIISDKRSLKRFRKAEIVRINSFVLSPYKDILAGEFDGCYVEFWERSDNPPRQSYLTKRLTDLRVNIEIGALSNTLVAPIENPFTGILPLDEVKVDSVVIGGKKYRTYDVFNQKTIHDIDFPIDIVYSWVDGSDAKWKERFNKYKGITENTSARNNTESRYKDRQELKYSLRSIHMYVPFVRNIYIVTDEQVPDWLDETVPGLKVIDHKEIFSDPSVLPVFNSHAIGAQIHHIKDLSDRYLYLNDDMMFGRLITPHKFFYPSGIAKVPVSPALIHAGSPKDYEPAPSSAGKNVRKALEETFGRYVTHKFKHSPNPQIKEVAYEIENKYPDLVGRTVSSRFRSKTDVQFASLFHHSYSLITGRAVSSVDTRSAVVNISQERVQGTLDELLQWRDAYTICLNESETPEERQEEVENMVHNFFERYYPYPSPWEKRVKGKGK
jgi:hypothetical protein